MARQKQVLYANGCTLFEFAAGRLQEADVVNLLRSLGVDGESSIQKHVDYLERRRSGQVSLADWLASRGQIILLVSDVAADLGLPIYTTRYASGNNFGWTLDFFNPKNIDCLLPEFDPDVEHLMLVVDDRFEPRSLMRRNHRSRPEIMSLYDGLFSIVKSIYTVIRPRFTFGAAHLQLSAYCDALARRTANTPASFRDVLWEWAIYEPSDRMWHLASDGTLRSIEERASDFHPLLGMWWEFLDETHVFVYSYEGALDCVVFMSMVTGYHDPYGEY